MTRQRGFTLVEILIVVAIVGILSALAIAHQRRARIAANEAATLADLRVVQSHWASNLGVSGSTLGCSVLPSSFLPAKSGYQRGCTSGVAWAVPQDPGVTGVRGFGADLAGRLCATEDGSIPPMPNCTVIK